MTPPRLREQLQAELAGLHALLHSAPADPLATPLMRSRVEEIEEDLRELHTAAHRAEAEIFFVGGPAIGSEGIEITFASDILESYQNMVTNHYTAKVYGSPRRSGRRRKEDETRLYLTALPRGSFGFQLSQPYAIAPPKDGQCGTHPGVSEPRHLFAQGLRRLRPSLDLARHASAAPGG